MLLGAHLYRLQTDNELLLSVSSAKRKEEKKDLPVQKGRRNAQPCSATGDIWQLFPTAVLENFQVSSSTSGDRKVVMVAPFPSLVMPPLRGRNTRPTCKPELLQSASGCRCPSRGGSGSTCCHGAGWWWTPGDMDKGTQLKELPGDYKQVTQGKEHSIHEVL